MKTLYIIRHAKSSWKDSTKTDFDRPLNKRGKADAPEMGKKLNAKQIKPQAILSSPAKRAISTAKKIAKEINFPEEQIIKRKEIYEADASALLQVITQLDNNIDLAFLVGHNPGLTNFINQFSDLKIENLVTCGIAGLTFNCSSWSDLSSIEGTHIFYDFPKNRPMEVV